MKRFKIAHEGGDKMPPDIFTKMFSDKTKWKRARHLINMIAPSELKEIVSVHDEIHGGILENRPFLPPWPARMGAAQRFGGMAIQGKLRFSQTGGRILLLLTCL